MAVGILLITHPHVGRILLETAVSLIGDLPVSIEYLDVPLANDTETVFKQADALCAKLDDGAGILVLTDLYGATPNNIAKRLTDKRNARIVSGVNLPMLMKTLNYCRLPLAELARKAYSGGRDNIIKHGT